MRVESETDPIDREFRNGKGLRDAEVEGGTRVNEGQEAGTGRCKDKDPIQKICLAAPFFNGGGLVHGAEPPGLVYLKVHHKSIVLPRIPATTSHF